MFVLKLTFMALNIFAADDILFYYYFSEKIRLDISCKMSGNKNGRSYATTFNDSLILCMLGRNFSRQHFEIMFLVFPRK